MIQKTSRKPGRMYRYYVCTGGKAEGCDCRPLHAAEVESMIIQEIKYAIQKAGIEHEVYEAFMAQCGERLKVLKLEEKMLTEQVDRLNRHTAAAIEKRDMEEWEKVKSEAAKAEEELMKTIRHKRILQGQIPLMRMWSKPSPSRHRLAAARYLRAGERHPAAKNQIDYESAMKYVEQTDFRP